MSTAGAPLAGTIVVSIGHTLPGLYCMALLRDLGAEVVRIERLRHGGAGDPYAGLDAAFPVRSLTAGTSVLHSILNMHKVERPCVDWPTRPMWYWRDFGPASPRGWDWTTHASQKITPRSSMRPSRATASRDP